MRCFASSSSTLEIVDVGEIVGGGVAREMKIALFGAKIPGKDREDQKEIRDEKRRQNEPQGNVGQGFFVRAQDRHHQQRQEKKSDVGLEVARTDRVGVDRGKIAEIFDFPLDAIFAHGACATPNGDFSGFGLQHAVKL